MDNVTTLRDRETVEAEACAWIAQLDGTGPSQEDLAALREWMSRSPSHRQAIEQLSVLWDDLNIFTELAVPRPDRVLARRHGLFRNFLRRIASPIPATAGLLLLTIGAVTSHLWMTGGTPPATSEDLPSVDVQSGNYTTAIGAQRSIALADGSRITLNTDSEVGIELSPHHRDIRLVKGEALFEVAKDPQRPFSVWVGNGLVRAIGTSFTVHLKDSENVAVMVTSGEVELATVATLDIGKRQDETIEMPAEPLVKIKAGQIATFGLDIESIQTLGEPELSRHLSWRDGMLRFEGEPLSGVVEEVSRYTTQKIVILDPALRDLRIGGYFKVGETEAMFEALDSSFGVRVERINDHLVHLSGRH